MVANSSFESVSGKLDTPFLDFHTLTEQPVQMAQQWFNDAVEAKVREPRSMVLTTANSQHIMSSRVMAVMSFSEEGVTFATHSCSRKINDVNDNPLACGHFYWKELGRQLSLSGYVSRLPHEVAQSAWDRRPVPLHSMSTVSHQSEPLICDKELRQAAIVLEEKGPLPCPDRFEVYLLKPIHIEFWAASSDRLHRRVHFELSSSGWSGVWLQP